MQAIFRTNLTQIAQLKEPGTSKLEMKKGLSISSRYQNYDSQELTKIQRIGQALINRGNNIMERKNLLIGTIAILCLVVSLICWVLRQQSIALIVSNAGLALTTIFYLWSNRN